jgi:hypothetical protein
MRTLYWGGLFGVTAGVLIVTAHCVFHHPECPVARCLMGQHGASCVDAAPSVDPAPSAPTACDTDPEPLVSSNEPAGEIIPAQEVIDLSIDPPQAEGPADPREIPAGFPPIPTQPTQNAPVFMPVLAEDTPAGISPRKRSLSDRLREGDRSWLELCWELWCELGQPATATTESRKLDLACPEKGDCREDPARHLQYPGCPQNGPALPVMPLLGGPGPGAGRRLPRTMPLFGDADEPVPARVDTLECRPSDLPGYRLPFIVF